MVLAASAQAAAPGDLNDDGIHDVRDLVLLEGHLRGTLSLDTEGLAAADVAPLALSQPIAGDALVDVADLTVLHRLVAGEDIDGDGLSTAFEIASGFSPLVRDEDENGIADGLDDSDQDGLTNRREEALGQNPNDSDSDGDDVLDGRDAPAPRLVRSAVTDLAAATAYLYTGIDPLQADLTLSLDPTRVAVLRGAVRDAAGTPMPDVAIRIEGRPEYGTTRTLADGYFDLVVHGGERMTVIYEREGHLLLRRRSAPVPLDYTTVAPVTLFARDAGGTGTVSLPAPATGSVWRGSPITDAAGTRRPTVIFLPGTTAEATLVGEETPIDLPEVTVRATETSVGVESAGTVAVPLDLAPSHDPIWVGELMVEEAEALGAVEKVEFDTPVIFYAEELLDYPTGTLLERGTLDEARGAWIPDTPGSVVTIVSINGSGEAEVDTDGVSGADNTGLATSERKRLGEIYTAGQRLIRYPLAHFSFGCGHKTQKGPADIADPDAADPKEAAPDDPCEQSGSIVGCESQTLGETIPIVGSPWSLHYTSRRTPGFASAYQVDVPMTGDSIPASLASGGLVSLEVEFAGRRESFGPFAAVPNLTQPAVTWVGTDAYGRVPQGRQPIRTKVRWHFPPAGAVDANGNAIPGTKYRSRVLRSREWRGFVGPWDNRAQGIGGWTLSPVHHYDARTQVLYRGDGSQVSAESLPSVIRSVSPTQLPYRVNGVAVAPDGQ